MTPKRIQRRRTKGWQMPTGAVYVGRPTRWGNPWKIGDPDPEPSDTPLPPITAQRAVDLFTMWMLHDPADETPKDLHRLRGRDLVCWCPLDQPCHADVLLELANGEKSP